MTERPIQDEERAVDAGAYLFSRTDTRGVIRFGNPLLAEVSGYDAGEMTGAPHRILRHPDMPRGIFWAMWHKLQRGEPVAAYLKNRCKDGRWFWCFAIVSPVAEGYLSVAMTPLDAGSLAQARALYPQMLEAEAAGASPEASAKLLGEMLAGHGFSRYEAFMAAATAGEAKARGSAGVTRALHTIESFDTLRQSIGQLSDEQDRLLETFTALHLVPTNMRILASRLEPSGGPISTISDSYKRSSAEITTMLARMTGSEGAACRDMLWAVENATFTLASSMLQHLAQTQFSESSASEARPELATLTALVDSAGSTARGEVEHVLREVRKIRKDGEFLQRLMSGLDQIRILGEVESGRNRNNDTGLAAIMEQLDGFHASIHTRLDAMIDLTSRMRARASRIAA